MKQSTCAFFDCFCLVFCPHELLLLLFYSVYNVYKPHRFSNPFVVVLAPVHSKPVHFVLQHIVQHGVELLVNFGSMHRRFRHLLDDGSQGRPPLRDIVALNHLSDLSFKVEAFQLGIFLVSNL